MYVYIYMYIYAYIHTDCLSPEAVSTANGMLCHVIVDR